MGYLCKYLFHHALRSREQVVPREMEWIWSVFILSLWGKLGWKRSVQLPKEGLKVHGVQEVAQAFSSHKIPAEVAATATEQQQWYRVVAMFRAAATESTWPSRLAPVTTLPKDEEMTVRQVNNVPTVSRWQVVESRLNLSFLQSKV